MLKEFLGVLNSTVETVGEVYRKKLYMFTKRELPHLLRYRTFMENPTGYLASYKKTSRKGAVINGLIFHLSRLLLCNGVLFLLLGFLGWALLLGKVVWCRDIF